MKKKIRKRKILSKLHISISIISILALLIAIISSNCEYNKTIKTIAINISYSIIAAYIFYVLQSMIPEIRGHNCYLYKHKNDIQNLIIDMQILIYYVKNHIKPRMNIVHIADKFSVGFLEEGGIKGLYIPDIEEHCLRILPAIEKRFNSLYNDYNYSKYCVIEGYNLTDIKELCIGFICDVVEMKKLHSISTLKKLEESSALIEKQINDLCCVYAIKVLPCSKLTDKQEEELITFYNENEKTIDEMFNSELAPYREYYSCYIGGAL